MGVDQILPLLVDFSFSSLAAGNHIDQSRFNVADSGDFELQELLQLIKTVLSGSQHTLIIHVFQGLAVFNCFF